MRDRGEFHVQVRGDAHDPLRCDGGRERSEELRTDVVDLDAALGGAHREHVERIPYEERDDPRRLPIECLGYPLGSLDEE